MSLSVLDIFKIGIGPSSSHTMGPMNAASAFVADLGAMSVLQRTVKVGAQVYGSLALTGKGHCTDRAIVLGLEGNRPDTLDPARVEPTLERIRRSGRLIPGGTREIEFDEPMDLLFHRDQVLRSIRMACASRLSMRQLRSCIAKSSIPPAVVSSSGPVTSGDHGRRARRLRPRTRSRQDANCSTGRVQAGSSCTSSCSPTSGRFAATTKPGQR